MRLESEQERVQFCGALKGMGNGNGNSTQTVQTVQCSWQAGTKSRMSGHTNFQAQNQTKLFLQKHFFLVFLTKKDAILIHFIPFLCKISLFPFHLFICFLHLIFPLQQSIPTCIIFNPDFKGTVKASKIGLLLKVFLGLTNRKNEILYIFQQCAVV